MANRENTFIEITPDVLLKAYACGWGNNEGRTGPVPPGKFKVNRPHSANPQAQASFAS